MKRLISVWCFLCLILSVSYAEDNFETTQKLAKGGNAKAQCDLGDMYDEGRMVEHDPSLAVYWYQKAAEQGYIIAQYNLGYMYANGDGVEKDESLAVYWYRRAAEQKDADSQCSLGDMYRDGRGVKQDYTLAVYWYRKAAAQGDADAQYNLGDMYRDGKGVKQNIEESKKWYKMAENSKNKRTNIVTVTEKGKYLPPLLVLAEEQSCTFQDANRNNRIDVGEQCNISFKIKNNGKGPANNCETRIKLSGTISGIKCQNIKLPIIAVGEILEVKIPIMADINTQDGRVTFSIEVYESNGWGIAPFDLTVATKAYDPPFLQVVDYSITSNSGKIRKMEPFTLSFNLQNTKYGNAEDVKVKINLPKDVFIMEGATEQSFPLLKSGEAKNISLSLAVNNNYPTTDIPVAIDITEKYGKFAENKQLNIALNQPARSSIQIAAKDEPIQERKEIQLAMLSSDVDRDIPSTSIKSENTFALIIANEHYQSVVPVPFALNDGKIFREYCIKTLGINEKHIKHITDATGNQIKAGVNWLANLTEAFDNPQIIVYYAGHGIPDEASKSAYLLPVDGSGSDITTGYKLDDLYSTLGNMPASHITVFMDACFSGSKREEGMLASARGVALKAKSGVPQGNMVVFSAAQGDETAYPNREQQHGLFTYYLLKKLQETKGDVDLKTLGEYVTKQVSQQSLLLNSKKQTPSVTPSATVASEWQSWKLK